MRRGAAASHHQTQQVDHHQGPHRDSTEQRDPSECSTNHSAYPTEAASEALEMIQASAKRLMVPTSARLELRQQRGVVAKQLG